MTGPRPLQCALATSFCSSMLHHISFGVRDLKLSSAFYDAALGALGFRRVFEDETAVGHGLEDGKDLFCLKLRPDAVVPGAGFHLAFSAPSRSAVGPNCWCSANTKYCGRPTCLEAHS